ncbi:MAG: glycosyltransferase [Helicobacteraceae bacterium]|nr:glycosyltransferase [Helicobacteraceae bacterium]
MNISAVIIVKNGIKTIVKTLDSLKEFNDVVVYDNGSDDGTQEIVKNYNNTNLVIDEFLGFGPTKNRAASFAKNEWILSIDADEVISEELLNSLKVLQLKNGVIYELFRSNFYKGYKLKHSGWGLEKLERLYNKSETIFNDKLVHERVKTDGFKMEQLQGELEHYSYHSLSDFIQKADVYSTAYAKDNVGKKSSSPLKAVLNAKYSFFRTYILKRGFLDGYAGLVIAFSHMVTNFYKYIKLYELNLELKK